MVRLSVKKMSLKQLQSLVNDRGPAVYEEVMAALRTDPRGGAQKLVKQCEQRMGDWKRERDRLSRMYAYERQVWAMGYRTAAGLDEVGRGPLAGPVVAAAVVLPGEIMIPGLEDCKRLSPRRRLEVHEEIRRVAVAIGTALVQPEGIDEASVVAATYKAMARAVAALPTPPDYLLVDGLHLPAVNTPQVAVVAGENQSISIAAASVVAKVLRDQHMAEMDRLYPQYGFAHHKGYGTMEHREALDRYGPCPIHRRNYAADREVVSLAGDSLDD